MRCLVCAWAAFASTALILAGGPAEARDANDPWLGLQGGHTDAITATAFSPDGAFVLTASRDQTVVLWERETRREVRTFQVDAVVYRAAFAPDGKHALTASHKNVVQLWDLRTGREVHTRAMRGHTSWVRALAVSPGGRFIATGSADKTGRLWDAATSKPLFELKGPAGRGHTDTVRCIAFRSDDAYVATGSRDGSIIVWSTQNGNPTRVLRPAGSKTGVTSLAYVPKTDHLVAGYADGSVRHWDAVNRKVMRDLPKHGGAVVDVSVRFDGRYVLTGCFDKQARLFDLSSGSELWGPKGHDAPVGAVAIGPKGEHALTAAGRRTLLWNLRSGEGARVLEGHAEWVLASAVSKDGRYLAVSTQAGTTHLWDLDAGRVVRRLRGPTNAVGSIAFSPDGSRLITGSEDNTVTLWDTRTGKPLRALQQHQGGTHSVGVSADGRFYVTGGCDQEVRIWTSTGNGTLVATLTGHEDNVESVALSRDGGYALTGSNDSTARLWSVAEQKELWRQGFGGPVTAVAFSPTNPTLFAAGSQDGLVRVFDHATRRLVQTLERGVSGVWAIAFSPDGKHLLTGTTDGTARIWKVGAPPRSPAVQVLQGHTERVKTAAFTHDGRFLVTGSYDQTVRMYDATSGKHVATLAAFEDDTWAVLDPEDRFDASNGGDIGGLYWLVPADNPAGAESVSLDQLMERYYEPGLLPKALGRDPTPRRAAQALRADKLAPKVSLTESNGRIEARITNRGAGIGKVVVQVNGKPVIADAIRPSDDANASELVIPLALETDAWFVPGQDNEIEVIAYDARDTIRSRGGRERRRSTAPKKRAELWAVIAGVSDYEGTEIDLDYALQDAVDFDKALKVAAKGFFEPAQTHIALVEGASRAALLQALENAGRAKPGDVFVLYLAGHGATHGDDFHYLTKEAHTLDLSDADLRAKATVSSPELAAALNKIPAQKVVMILDTCASGAVVESLAGQRGATPSHERALHRLKTQTGMHVIAGCAADRLSYENPRYGQGLLTYSLLLAMKRGQLRQDRYVDVATLFTFAENRVPELAQEIGKRQIPVVGRPRGGGTFDLGELSGTDRAELPVRTPKPCLTMSQFWDEQAEDDVHGLATRLDEALRAGATPDKKAPYVYWNVGPQPDCYRVVGKYKTVGDQIEVTFRLRQGTTKNIADGLTAKGTLEELPAAMRAIVLKNLPASAK